MDKQKLHSMDTVATQRERERERERERGDLQYEKQTT